MGRRGRELYPACFKDVFKAVKFLIPTKTVSVTHRADCVCSPVQSRVVALVQVVGRPESDWSPAGMSLRGRRDVAFPLQSCFTK